MSIDSAIFLFAFLPLLLILEAAIRPIRAKNVLLCLAGLIFYAFGELWALAALIASALVNWALGLWAMRGVKAAVVCAAALNLALLGVCKYLGFLGEGMALIGVQLNLPAIVAPAGVSFFTFKGISYVVDACRRPENGSKNFFRVLFYISFLPEVMSGPLSRFENFEGQLSSRERSIERTAHGLRRFILGLAKKLLLSGGCAILVDAAFSAGEALDARMAWLGAIAYSDMAVGLGAMLGFACPENFNYPYAATSITNFWRRWHITLSSWFRDYLYIPLGGSRRGKWRAAFNKAVVFVLCGLWHGANMTFVLWGAWHALLSALESLKVLDVARWRKTAVGRVISRVYTLLAVCLGFAMFRAESVSQGFEIIGAMFTGWDFTIAGDLLLARSVDSYTLATLVISAVLSLPVLRKMRDFAKRSGERVERRLELASYFGCLALVVVCVSALARGGFTPFIYFQF